MLNPAYKLTIGKKFVDTTDKPQASTVVDVVVCLDMGVPADSATVVLGNVDGFKPAEGDAVTLELGDADGGGLTKVITASVVTVEPGLTNTRVIAFSGADSVLRTFVDQTYESKTAGAIVSDLAGRAGVTVASADDGITFPAYVVDGRRSAYQHMHDLAELCGFDLYLNPDGELVFEAFAGGTTVHPVEYGKDMLALDVLRVPALAGEVDAWGESPTGSAGANAWPWLTKDFSSSKGTAGSGSPLLLQRPVLRTATAAGLAATAALITIQRQTLRGRVSLPGLPAVKLGDAVELKSLPQSALNATYQVRSVTHRVNKRLGFTTVVEFRSIQP